MFDGVGILERRRLFCLRFCSLEAVFRPSDIIGGLLMSGVIEQDATLEDDDGVAIKLLRVEVALGKVDVGKI